METKHAFWNKDNWTINSHAEGQSTTATGTDSPNHNTLSNLTTVSVNTACGISSMSTTVTGNIYIGTTSTNDNFTINSAVTTAGDYMIYDGSSSGYVTSGYATSCDGSFSSIEKEIINDGIPLDYLQQSDTLFSSMNKINDMISVLNEIITGVKPSKANEILNKMEDLKTSFDKHNHNTGKLNAPVSPTNESHSATKAFDVLKDLIG